MKSILLAATCILAICLSLIAPAKAAVFDCPSGNVACLINAINTANANGEDDTIRLERGIYTLTAADNADEGLGPNGLPVITSTTEIRGESASNTVIERAPDAADFRIIQVATTGNLTIEMLTIQRGRAVERMGQQAGGAGIHNNQGVVKIINSVVVNNFSKDFGGGVYNRGGQMEITSSTIQDNQSWSTGGVATAGGSGVPDAALIISNSTIANNESLFQSGGGIGNGGQLLTIVNTTIANNSADGGGGGISSGSGAGTVTIINSTIYNNFARISEENGDISHRSPDPLQLQNSILGVCADTIDSSGYNILGELRNCDIDLQPTDMTGDPGLGVFTDDGTPGGGHFPLLVTSQAIDSGNNDACSATDQLNNPRVDGNEDGTVVCDVGAIEFQTEVLRAVDIDIKPGNKHNVINPRAKGGIWVAILSDTDPESPFDPSSQINIPTVEFGPDGATATRHKVKDINKDGIGDLLLRFKIRETGIACGDTEATLTGETFDGQSFTGTDSIKTVGCKSKKDHKKKYHKKHHDDDHKKR